MKNYTIDYGQVPYLSDKDLAYLRLDDRLAPFYRYRPELRSFEQVISDRLEVETDRNVLIEVLQDQYKQLTSPTANAYLQIEKLSRTTTFTITTAHQPALFTGPLYVVYKIISTLVLSQQLNDSYPDYDFIPVFVTGGEDHDFEEINHLRLFGKTITWNNRSKGPVGRMSTQTLDETLLELQEILGTASEAQKVYQLIAGCHQHKTYGISFIDLINALFGKYGLVVLGMDEPRLKRKMISLFANDLTEHDSAKIVRETQQELKAAGFEEQAYVRDINLFYLQDNLRSRIEHGSGQYQVVDTGQQLTRQQLLKELEEHPENFSPNVILRPLYQETILPNLAYIGGGGEIAYWLERKSQFEFFGVNFPMLVRRDSCLWIDQTVSKRLKKLEVDIADFFMDENTQIKKFVAEQAENEFKLGKEKGEIIQLFKQIEAKAGAIDPTLKSTVAAEGRNQIKALEYIEDKLRKAEKQKHEIALNQLRTVREKIFPERSLQERKDNFLNYYLRLPDRYFDVLLEHFNPLDRMFKIIEV